MARKYWESCIPKIPVKFGMHEWLSGPIFAFSAFFAVNLIA